MVEIWRWPNASYERVVDGLHRRRRGGWQLSRSIVSLSAVPWSARLLSTSDELLALAQRRRHLLGATGELGRSSRPTASTGTAVADTWRIQRDVLHGLQVKRDACDVRDGFVCRRGMTFVGADAAVAAILQHR